MTEEWIKLIQKRIVIKEMISFGYVLLGQFPCCIINPC
jgi:hypothetical protein